MLIVTPPVYGYDILICRYMDILIIFGRSYFYSDMDILVCMLVFIYIYIYSERETSTSDI